MAIKEVKYDFFSIEIPESVLPPGKKLVDVLDLSLPNQIARPIKYKDQYIRLESYRIDNFIRVGSATKITMEGLPSKVDIQKPGLQGLGLKQSEGVASLTSFVIAPQYNALILQRNNQGVRAGSFVHLIETLTGLSDITLNLMLDQYVTQKLNRMQFISKFLVRISNPITPEAYRDTSAKEAARLSRHYNASSVKIELSIGQGPRKLPLSIDAVKQSIRSLLRMNEAGEVAVESLVIRGKGFDDEKITPLDLIKERITCSIDVATRGREFPQEELERAAYAAFLAKENELKAYKPLE
ncbi:MAG: DUF6731 family protein [Moorellaceae bacterium]